MFLGIQDTQDTSILGLCKQPLFISIIYLINSEYSFHLIERLIGYVDPWRLFQEYIIMDYIVAYKGIKLNL